MLGSNASALAQELIDRGADKVFAVESPALDNFVDELATTGRFVRPYERVEIAPQRTFVKTIARMPKLPVEGVTGAFDTVWFGASETSLVALEEPEPIVARTSWWWLAISVAAGGAAIAALYLM